MIDIVWEYFWVWNTKNSKFQVSGLWTYLDQHACRCITLNCHQILMFFWNVLENIVWHIIQNNPFAIELSHKLAVDNFCFDFEETKWLICLKICQTELDSGQSYNSLWWIQSRNSLPEISFDVSFWYCINHWFGVPLNQFKHCFARFPIYWTNSYLEGDNQEEEQ